MTFPAEVRAVHLRMLVDALTVLGDDHASSVHQAVPAWILERIRSAESLEWLPAEFMVEVCEATRREVDDAGLLRWGNSLLHGTLSGALLGAFYEVARAFTRSAPSLVFETLTRGWPLLYRGCGDLVVTDRAPGSIRVVHTPVPEVIRRAATVLPLLGALQAIPELWGAAAEIDAEWSPDVSRFVYAIRWPATDGGKR